MTGPKDVDRVEAAALDWVIRQRAPDFDAWDDFTEWLEADPAHADIYQALATADADMDPLIEQVAPPPVPVGAPVQSSVPAPAPANDDIPSRRLWIVGALAASLVAAIGIGVMLPRSAPWTVETGPGERRSVELADGSQVLLNGGTRIVLDRHAPRRAILEKGEAMFIVRHDASDPFEVRAGSARLIDVGTAFNVVREGKGLDVAVSEGAVLYNPDGERARIDAGRRLQTVEGEDRYRISAVESDAVAGWRDGRLVYDGQPLSTVAADLARYYGMTVRASPTVGARLFRGVLTLPPRKDIATLAPVLGVAIRGDDSGWTLSTRR